MLIHWMDILGMDIDSTFQKSHGCKYYLAMLTGIKKLVGS